ncbi:hypothetical protein NMY3_02020 [Candidatus Nitrosocosmicus oleophilus]|uniref:Uncharacterized protein n=1 Tax=Candidatus Nitrosocosmicus oleophilus TaxID=1353260 RepID=A0A654M9P9_9ARCH|nr:hypothetical protein NMY3_02020 [Candidatus Nitrosocosmicus oleophilus]
MDQNYKLFEFQLTTLSANLKDVSIFEVIKSI